MFMGKNVIPLSNLPKKKKAKIVKIHRGRHFHRRMCVMGIREGQIVEVVSKQPLMGPLTISAGKCQMTIGRGMAHKILVEEL